MKEELLNYMIKRSDKLTKLEKSGGPVITISREKGCPSHKVAERLAQILTSEKKGEWRYVNREIIEESARELHMNPLKINPVLYSEDKGFFRDLMLSFGEKYYHSDVSVKKTLAELVTSFSKEGKVIIVGIGGVAITRNIEKSFHIKLCAPYKWRLNEVMKKENMSSERARAYMDETDVNRQMLIDYYNGFKANNDLFHVQYNTSLLSVNEIADSVFELLKLRKLV